DEGRLVYSSTTLADAARQASRQGAAVASRSDNPFGATPTISPTYNGLPCEGQALPANQTGVGCLTDAALYATAKTGLASLTTVTTLYAATKPAGCGTPPAGAAYVCIYPAESGITPTAMSCTAASYPAPLSAGAVALGSRREEWTANAYRGGNNGNDLGCFYITVTVKFSFQALTPGVSSLLGSTVLLTSTSTTLAEY
ncbi:MAG: hypothetical protein ABR541_00240, partial [Candidatus Dormibacteria bacterium]